MYGYEDDAARFAFFSKAALEYMLKANKRPDVIHCHDWQDRLVPVLLFEIYKFHGWKRLIPLSQVALNVVCLSS